MAHRRLRGGVSRGTLYPLKGRVRGLARAAEYHQFGHRHLLGAPVDWPDERRHTVFYRRNAVDGRSGGGKLRYQGSVADRTFGRASELGDVLLVYEPKLPLGPRLVNGSSHFSAESLIGDRPQ